MFLDSNGSAFYVADSVEILFCSGLMHESVGLPSVDVLATQRSAAGVSSFRQLDTGRRVSTQDT